MTRSTSTSIAPTAVSPTERILGLPRIAKILLVAFLSLMVVLALQPAIDYLYLTRFFSAETLMAPALVAVVPGMIMYVLGWWLLLWSGPVRRVPLNVYLGVGLFVTTIVVVLLVYGVISAGQAG